MNILLAYKAEPDLAMLVDSAWQAATATAQGPDVALLPVVSGSDEQAGAELMLTARDAAPEIQLSAISVGDERACYGLRHLAALGFSQRILVETPQDLRFSPAFVAAHIAAWQREQGAQLIITGSQSSEGQNGQLPWLLAEMLGWHCLGQVSDFTVENKMLHVVQDDGALRREWQLTAPAVLAVRNKGQVALRVPGMRQRLAAANAPITRLTAEMAATGQVNCGQLTRCQNRRGGAIVSGNNAGEKARRLWDMYLRQRMTP